MMTRKRKVVHHESLRVRLAALEAYIVHHELKLDQFKIELEKAIHHHPREGIGGLVGRLENALDDLWASDPRKSLVESDLADARMAFNRAVSNMEEHAALKVKLLETGYSEEHSNRLLDFALSGKAVYIITELNNLALLAEAGDGSEDLSTKLTELMLQVFTMLDAALIPARYLRTHWLNILDGNGGATEIGVRLPKKRGRRKDPAIKTRDEKIRRKWKTGTYKTYRELGDEMGCTKEIVRKAVAAAQKRLSLR
jgi:hypothetical protein